MLLFYFPQLRGPLDFFIASSTSPSHLAFLLLAACFCSASYPQTYMLSPLTLLTCLPYLLTCHPARRPPQNLHFLSQQGKLLLYGAVPQAPLPPSCLSASPPASPSSSLFPLLSPLHLFYLPPVSPFSSLFSSCPGIKSSPNDLP